MPAHQEKFKPTITLPKGREFNGGDLLAQTLKHLEVEIAFGLHGGHLDAFLMGAHEVGIKLIDTRHETAAVQAAEGYNKVKNKVGVCFVTANSGFCNGIPGLATAFADRSSILCITSSSPQRDSEANVLQGFHDQIVLSAPITRFAHRVIHAEEIPRLVAYAWRRATASPPGPVLLDFPIEVLFSPVQLPRISWGSVGAPLAYPPGPNPEAIRKAVQLIKTSKRPVIVTGSGARGLREDNEFIDFVNAAQIPVFASSKYSSPLPFNSRLRCGNISRLSALGSMKHPQPDLVLILGARSGMFFGSRSSPSLPSGEIAKYVHVDIDSAELGRMIPVDVGITSDVSTAVTALSQQLRDAGYQAPSDWAETVLSLKTLPLPWESEAKQPQNGKMHPYHALKAVFQALPANSIITIDSGEAGLWAATVADAARPHEVIQATGYLGFLGNAWGYALGASEAERGRLIVNLQGDGSACFHIAELDTYARFGCQVLTIVMNNHCWGMSMHGQEILYGHLTEARPTAHLSPSMDFAAVAKGAGCEGEKVDNVEHISDAVSRLLQGMKGGRPGLLELLIDEQPTHPATLAMVGRSSNDNEVVIPYYDNIPRARYV